MKRKNEKKIYELLGVNVFRKYILFTWEKIAKFLHIDVGYRLDDMSIDSLKGYKTRAISFAIAHIVCFIICLPIVNGLASGLTNFFLNFYCIIVQRYNYIRIEEIEEKYNKMMELKEKREQRLAKKRRDELEQKYGDALKLMEVFVNNHIVVNKDQETAIKVVESKKFNIPSIPEDIKKTSLDDVIFNDYEKVYTLTKKVV